MNPNCCPGSILEDTFNSDHNLKVLAVALSAPLSTSSIDRPYRLYAFFGCVSRARSMVNRRFTAAPHFMCPSTCSESSIAAQMLPALSVRRCEGVFRAAADR